MNSETKKAAVVSAVAFCLLVAVCIAVATRYDAVAADAPYYSGVTGENRVALCFNVDWGEDQIPAVLRILEEHDATATFFLTGRWTDRFPECALSIKKAGMTIGNHGLKHDHPDGMSYEENVADIAAAEGIIEEILGVKTTLFAPAAGECGAAVQKAAADSGYALILWSVDTIDWQKPDPATIVQRVTSKVADGSIVLMHPTENTVKALPEILAYLAEQGLSTVAVDALIRP